MTAEARVEAPVPEGLRLDVFISETMGLFSRSQVKSRVTEVRVNGKSVRLSRKLKAGDVVAVDYTHAPPISAEPEDIPLDVIFENDDVIVVNKPQGMVVHPGSGNHTGTLVNALLFHCGGLSKAFGAEEIRPGIVHRLDKETSGVIIAAKNPHAHELLSAQFKARKTRKLYAAILQGGLKEPRGRLETLILRDSAHRKRFACSAVRGRQSVTLWKVVRTYSAASASMHASVRASAPTSASGTRPARLYTLVILSPKTGRTHQLRVHMRHLSAPILGDDLYGRPDPLFPDARLMLHAMSLTILLPGEEKPRTFRAPLPGRFREILGSQSLSPR